VYLKIWIIKKEMPNYECVRCHKIFKQKSNYDSHVKRKNPCKVVEKNIIQFKCEFCGKFFTKKSSLNRHINNTCKFKRDNDKKIEQQIQEMKEEIEKLKKELQVMNNTNVIGNNNNNNTQINNTTINIVAYGKEDIDSILSNEDFKRIINKGMSSVPELIKRVHFDKKIPENHNIYISNLRDSYVFTYDGNTWRLNNRDEALHRLYDAKSEILNAKFEELKDTELSNRIVEKYERCADYIKEDEENHTKDVREEIKKILYENKDMVIRTRKQADSS
jgi:uncharacterized C2H2 Zn-finger protein